MDCTNSVGTLTDPHLGHLTPFSAIPFFAFSAKSCCFAIVTPYLRSMFIIIQLIHPDHVAACLDRLAQHLRGISQQLNVAGLTRCAANSDTDRY
jgi:hypothetical protein